MRELGVPGAAIDALAWDIRWREEDATSYRRLVVASQIPWEKTVSWNIDMKRAVELLDRFIQLSKEALEQDIEPETLQELPVVRKLQRVGEDVANGDEEAISALNDELEHAFESLINPQRGEAA